MIQLGGRLWALAIVGWFLGACSTAPALKPQAAKSQASEVAEFNRIKAESARGKSDQSVVKLQKFIANHPRSELAASAQIWLGNIYTQRQDYRNAYANYSKVFNSEVASVHDDEARLLAARSLLYLGRSAEARDLLKQGLSKANLNNTVMIDMRELRFSINHQTNQGDSRLEALKDLAILATNHPDRNKRERFRLKGVEIVNTRLRPSELQSVAESNEYGAFQNLAAARLNAQQLQAREQIETQRRVQSRTIGVILPLSGKFQKMGYRSLRGIQLALGVFQNNTFRLAVIDSASNPDLARRAVDRLVNEDQVIGIVGGLLSKTAAAEAAHSQELGVPFIALSQGAGVTDLGPAVFRNALTSQMQVRNLVATAMDKMGMKKFAIMYPSDPYGLEYSNLFWDEVVARGGQITGAQSYDPKETDFRVPVQKLVGTHDPDERADEYRLRLKEWQEKSPRKLQRKPPDNLLPPIIDFDAIFIPDSAKAVGQIAPMLAYNDVDGVRLIGTNLWNTPELVKRGQKFVEGALFVDSFVENDTAFTSSSFYIEFKQSFNEEPGLFELQAYDAALVLRKLVSQGATSRRELTEALAASKNLAGALGPLNVNENREIIRPMVNLTVQKGEIVKWSNSN